MQWHVHWMNVQFARISRRGKGISRISRSVTLQTAALITGWEKEKEVS